MWQVCICIPPLGAGFVGKGSSNGDKHSINHINHGNGNGNGRIWQLCYTLQSTMLYYPGVPGVPEGEHNVYAILYYNISISFV